jgi:polar amino acid transport system substrate-binding protein
VPAQSIVETLAPTGRLRVAVWTLPFFALERAGALEGIIPDLAAGLARRLGVPLDLTGYAAPAALVEAFRGGAVDATFVGVTADRAEVIDFGPVILDIQTSYLVPASSAIARIADVDRPGVRILVPSRSAQEAHLKKTIAHVTLIPVPPENPKEATELLGAGRAEAFSHVAPMLGRAQGSLPGSRILPGSYFNVPIAIGIAKGRPPAAADYARQFAEDVKASGFVQQAIDRADVKGIVVAT